MSTTNEGTDETLSITRSNELSPDGEQAQTTAINLLDDTIKSRELIGYLIDVARDDPEMRQIAELHTRALKTISALSVELNNLNVRLARRHNISLWAFRPEGE